MFLFWFPSQTPSDCLYLSLCVSVSVYSCFCAAPIPVILFSITVAVVAPTAIFIAVSLPSDVIWAMRTPSLMSRNKIGQPKVIVQFNVLSVAEDISIGYQRRFNCDREMGNWTKGKLANERDSTEKW